MTRRLRTIMIGCWSGAKTLPEESSGMCEGPFEGPHTFNAGSYRSRVAPY
jgi:hypothetical protein